MTKPDRRLRQIKTAILVAATAAAFAIPGAARAVVSGSLVAAAQSPALLANLSLSISLTTHAVIPSGQTAAISSISTTGTHGSVVKINSTTVSYTPGSFYASLAAGSAASDKFSFCLSDTAGSISCNTVNVTIFGAESAPASPTPPATSAGYTCMRNWYVAQNGSDKAAGNSIATPWQTLQHADSSGLLKAGDCVNVGPGTYPVTATTYLNTSGNANSATGYIVYRSTTPHGAIIKAAAQNMYDVLDVDGDYTIIDGFEINGGNLGLSSNAFTYGHCLSAGGHHFQALNNLVHDCGGAGIAASEKDWYTIEGNTVYNNAFFNQYHSSGIAIYAARAVTYTPTTADTSAAYHIIIKNNISHDNSERFVQTAHTDGNGIIMDDFQNTQTTNIPYPYKTLVQDNQAYNNGGSGIHVYETDNVTITGNAAFSNNADATIASIARGELFNGYGTNNTWTNNQASTTSLTTGWGRYNVAVLDGSSTNVVWTNNANIDARTGARSYLIDNAARAATFPSSNPIGKVLSPSS